MFFAGQQSRNTLRKGNILYSEGLASDCEMENVVCTRCCNQAHTILDYSIYCITVLR